MMCVCYRLFNVYTELPYHALIVSLYFFLLDITRSNSLYGIKSAFYGVHFEICGVQFQECDYEQSESKSDTFFAVW